MVDRYGNGARGVGTALGRALFLAGLALTLIASSCSASGESVTTAVTDAAADANAAVDSGDSPPAEQSEASAAPTSAPTGSTDSGGDQAGASSPPPPVPAADDALPTVDLNASLDPGVATIRDEILAAGRSGLVGATCLATEVTRTMDPARAYQVLDTYDGTDDELAAVDTAADRCYRMEQARGLAPGDAPADEAAFLSSDLVVVQGDDAIDGISGALGYVTYDVSVPPGIDIDGDWNYGTGFSIELAAQPTMSTVNLLEQEVGYLAGEGDEGIPTFEDRGGEQWVIAVDNADPALVTEIALVRQFVLQPSSDPLWDYAIECFAGFYQEAPFADVAAVQAKLESVCNSIDATALTEFEAAS